MAEKEIESNRKYFPTFDLLHNALSLSCWPRAGAIHWNWSDILSSADGKSNYKANMT